MFPCSHSLFPSPSSGRRSCPLIGPRCYVRPVQPTGLAAVFLLDKGNGIGSPLCRTAPEDAADPVPTPPIPLRQKAGESKGVLPLVLEVRSSSNSKPGGSWRIFAYFLYVRK